MKTARLCINHFYTSERSQAINNKSILLNTQIIIQNRPFLINFLKVALKKICHKTLLSTVGNNTRKL